MMVCGCGLKLQERIDDTPESCRLVFEKEERVPSRQREIQEKLPPTFLPGPHASENRGSKYSEYNERQNRLKLCHYFSLQF